MAFDILFVNDESRDATERLIPAAADERDDVALINLSRNFGKEAALFARAYPAFIFARTLLCGVHVPGYASTIILVLAFGGINMFALGIIGEYVGRIYTEVRRRPVSSCLRAGTGRVPGRRSAGSGGPRRSRRRA
ncbi:MAG TPA: hypothetical protein DEO85_13535 [Maritimibacter sp.]|nr:hypothetical protein [Maritimibacter sp.]